MPRGRAVRIGLAGMAALLVVLLLVGVTLVAVFVRRPFPDYDGELTLPGLDRPVTVLRDERGIPQVYADTATDLFRAQGYVHAQDRFFEMDVRRHVTAGRLSELIGPNEDALRSDAIVRTLGWRRVAEQELGTISRQSRSYLEAYAAGVNDYLRTRSAASLSVNYTVLDLGRPLRRIEPWTPVDSLAWLKAMAWDLRTNYSDELDRARMFASVRDTARIGQLFPGYPYGEHQAVITGGRVAPGQAEAADRIAEVFRAAPVQQALDRAASNISAIPALVGRGGGIGSNSWVVSGRLTESGKPLLANDPHLSTSMPGIWYQVGLHCRQVGPQCPFTVSGYSFAGLPGVVIGHNARIAWGLTNLRADVTDFYLEQVSGDTALRDGRQVPLTRREETIAVAGGSPVRITVSATEHGPIVSDVLEAVGAAGRSAPVAERAPERGNGYAVSMAWTALTPGRTMDAIFALDAAADVQGFRQAARLVSAPAQGIVYADVDGRIAYQAAGRVPIRADRPADGDPVPSNGTWPQPGWSSTYDWRGVVAPADMPGSADPADGFIVAANQAITGLERPTRFTQDWDYGYRSQRIRQLLTAAADAGRKLRVADMSAIQADTFNPMAAELVPVLRQAQVDRFTRQGVDELNGWDYTQPADSAAAAFFNAVWASLLELTFADELPEGTRPDGGDRWFRVVHNLLRRPRDQWWDDRRTPGVVETRDEIVRRAVVQARLQLTSTLGKDPGEWQWGRMHQLRLRQLPLGSEGSPGIVQWLVNRGPFQVPGGSSLVNAMGWDAADGSFDVAYAPSMRMVVDLSDLDRSRWVNQSGNSGHPGNRHYDDQLQAWLEGESFAWPFSERAVRGAATDTQVLRPAG